VLLYNSFSSTVARCWGHWAVRLHLQQLTITWRSKLIRTIIWQLSLFIRKLWTWEGFQMTPTEPYLGMSKRGPFRERCASRDHAGPRAQRRIETRSFTTQSLVTPSHTVLTMLPATDLANDFRWMSLELLTRDAKCYRYNAQNSTSAGAPPQTRWGAHSASSDPFAGFWTNKKRGEKGVSWRK